MSSIPTALTALGLVAASGLGTVPASAVPSIDASALTTHYSLTQWIQNDSSENLTLASSRVDNGATITYAQTTIAPHSSGLVIATNASNGIQMWLTFTSDTGSAFNVDTDVPRTNPNWSVANRTDDRNTLDMTSASIGGGDKATAKTVVSDCTPTWCRTSTAIPDGPP